MTECAPENEHGPESNDGLDLNQWIPRHGRMLWLHALNAIAIPVALMLFFILSGHDLASRDHLLVIAIILGLSLLHFVSAIYWWKAGVTIERHYRTELSLRNHQLHNMAMRDDLTGLFNRRFFYEYLQQEIERCCRSQCSLSLLILDIDGFKAINDNHGHQIGDMVLAHMGKLLAEHTRKGDVAARIGGDEFAVIMPDTDREEALTSAERLQRALEEACLECPQRAVCPVHLRVSMGVCGYPWGAAGIDQIVQVADDQMYAAKAARKEAATAG